MRASVAVVVAVAQTVHDSRARGDVIVRNMMRLDALPSHALSHSGNGPMLARLPAHRCVGYSKRAGSGRGTVRGWVSARTNWTSDETVLA